MIKEQLILDLDIQWSENGFFEKLRYARKIDFEQGHTLLNSIKSFSLDDTLINIDRNLVRLLWYIPQFMNWQIEKLSENNEKEIIQEYIKLCNLYNNELERILRLP